MTERTAKASLAFSCAGHFYNHLFDPIFYVAALVLPTEFDMPYEQVLLLIVAGKLLWGLGAPVAGVFGDRWSTVGMIAVYFFGLGFSALLAGLSQTPFQLAASLTLLGVFGCIYHPVGIAWVVRHAERRGRVLGINGFFGGIGPAIAAMSAAVLIEAFGWRSAFLVPACLVLATGVFFLWMAKLGVVREVREDRKPHLPSSKRDTVRAYMTLTLTMLCNGIIYQSTQAGLPKLFEENAVDALGGGLLGIGGAVMVVYTIAGLLQIMCGHLADRYPAKYVYMGSIFLQAPLLALAGHLLGLPLVMVAMMMVTFNIGALPAENVLFARFTPPNWRGTAFGFKFILSFGVSSLGVPLVAWTHGLGDGFLWLFVILACLALLAASAALMLPSAKRM